uniref:Mitotic spindle assembly checkpoint protein MAD1 n=1 Tax=Takifugu rubripes TaxID=31033 RepID=A0A674PJ29_TAKRU
MDLEDDTTVLTTLKSFNSFISRTEPQQRLTERPGSGTLQGQYKRSMELLEAADRLNSTNRYLQLDQEKKQMELSHKRARFELEKTASDRTRALEHEVDRNQELLTQIKKLKERESEMERNLTEKGDANRALWKNLEALNKKLEDRDGRLSSANQTVSTLKDEVRELKQKIQNQDCTICAQTLENQELQEQLDLQRRKYQDVSQLYQSLQATQSTCSDHVIKIKELERRLALQEQDVAIMKTVKSELARVPGMEKELKNLRGDNSFLRESRENCSLLKEEVEGLRKKLERMEKMKEDLVNMELEKNRVCLSVRARMLTVLCVSVCRKPEDLSREVIQIQQREFALKEQNYTLNSRSAERSHSDVCAELSEQRGKTLEEKKKRELQDTLVRRLQKRLMLLNKERDGMRAILESYDSELGSTEYSPQLSKRLKEAEDVLQRTQNHNVELEVRDPHSNAPHLALTPLQDCWSFRLCVCVCVCAWTCVCCRQKIEDLEADRQRLEEQNNNLEMRLERHNLQGDYDPLKTRVLHLKMNPTSVAKQQRQQEMETIQEEVTRLRELVRSLQDGGSLVQSQDDSIVPNLGLGLPPSKEVLDLRKQMESSELKNQRLKEVFQRKIQEFRTVCYILTGYQMDITTENQYRLTSVYAEHMDDSLLFKKGSNGSMQLMETEFSKTLGEMVSLHLHHQKSIPAFLSAVTLDLFSRQTTI